MCGVDVAVRLIDGSVLQLRGLSRSCSLRELRREHEEARSAAGRAKGETLYNAAMFSPHVSLPLRGLPCTSTLHACATW